jgi:PAS domain S-box-containing protein
VTGWDSSSVVGKNIATFLHADDVPAVRAALARVVAKPGATEEFEVRVQHKDGHVISADVQGRNYLDDPDVGGIVVTMRDITERKRATQALLDAENRYRSIFTESRDGIVLVDAATAYVVDCNPEFERQCARPLKELQRLHVWELRPSEMRDASRAKFEEIKAAGHGGSQELPLLRPDGSVLAVEFTSKRLNVAGHDLVQSACRDITERRRAELAQAQSADRLRHSMEGTIQAMAATLEMRDAYTAGHQRRVAELAVAIAHELKFSDNEIHGLHLAAVVHDLGKIQVPAEILSKPTKLSPIEYELVKSHAQAGYDILKTVEFEWPLAQIVYQHHERLDGSGYPRGLKGDEILPGAKILAVADTIEAMYSHRPYRAGLGIDAALAEIVRNRGVKYDASIVDACVKLFRENKFAFSA